MKIFTPHILLIAGTGQNVGKTTLVCQLINKHAPLGIVAIKISPHFHTLSPRDQIIINHPNFTIIQEQHTSSGKDSSRMLLSGAKRVFYVQVKDNYLQEAFYKVSELIPPETPVICESGGLINIVKPGVFIMVRSKDPTSIKSNTQQLLKQAHAIVEFNGHEFNPLSLPLSHTPRGWRLEKHTQQ